MRMRSPSWDGRNCSIPPLALQTLDSYSVLPNRRRHDLSTPLLSATNVAVTAARSFLRQHTVQPYVSSRLRRPGTSVMLTAGKHLVSSQLLRCEARSFTLVQDDTTAWTGYWRK